jgi:hypothetical protein
MCIFKLTFFDIYIYIGNKSGFLAGIMRRYSKDLALAADADNSGNLCIFDMPN